MVAVPVETSMNYRILINVWKQRLWEHFSGRYATPAITYQVHYSHRPLHSLFLQALKAALKIFYENSIPPFISIKISFEFSGTAVHETLDDRNVFRG